MAYLSDTIRVGMPIPEDEIPASFRFDKDAKAFVKDEDGDLTLYYNEEQQDYVMSSNVKPEDVEE